jgi:hypothetical protein
MKLWRPRYSVRTLAILVTLVCAYFGAWEITKSYGVPVIQQSPVSFPIITEALSPMPFVIRQHEVDAAFSTVIMQRYYLWIFGVKIALPRWDSQLPMPEIFFPSQAIAFKTHVQEESSA